MDLLQIPMKKVLIYILTVGIVSACGLIIEIVAGRMLAPYLGMSLYTWTAIIAVVLAGLSVGHWIGGIYADHYPKNLERLVAWVLFFSSISAAASLILLRVLSGPIINLGLSPVPTISILTMTLFFLPSFFVGIPAPILTKLALQIRTDKSGEIVGLIFAAGSFGGIVGTLFAGYVLISWLGTVYSILLVSGIYLILSGLYFLLSHERLNRAFIWFVAPVILMITAVYSIGNATLAFQSNCTEESDYYCVRIVDISQNVGQEARMMVLDNLSHGMNLKDSPTSFASSYIELSDLIVKLYSENLSQISAYFVGGGAYTLPRAWNQQFPEMKITVAEIDPIVTKLAMDQMWLQSASNLKIVHEDARLYLGKKQNKDKYDVVIGDAFHDIAVPQHLITSEFFALIKENLDADGLYIMTVVDRIERPRLVLSMIATLKKTFSNVQVWFDTQQQGRITFVVTASDRFAIQKANLSSSSGRVWQRWNGSQIARMNTQFDPIQFTDDYAPIDRLIDHSQSN